MQKGEIRNATITGTRLGFSRGVFLDAMLTLDYGGAGQGFGGYVLAKKNELPDLPYTGLWVSRILEVLGVDSWEDLRGVSCRVDSSHSKVYGIGHYLKDEWFYPEQEFEKLKAKGERELVSEYLSDIGLLAVQVDRAIEYDKPYDAQRKIGAIHETLRLIREHRDTELPAEQEQNDD